MGSNPIGSTRNKNLTLKIMDKYLRRQIYLILYLLLLIAVMFIGYYSGKYSEKQQQKIEIIK